MKRVANLLSYTDSILSIIIVYYCYSIAMDTQTKWEIMYISNYPSEAVFILSEQTNPLPRKLLHQSQECRGQGC